MKLQIRLRMTRKIITLLTIAVLFTVSQKMSAQDVQKDQSKAQIESELVAPNIVVNKAVVRIKTAQGYILEIYNLAGVKIKNIRIDSKDKAIELDDLPKGCYLLRIGKTTRKFYIN